MSKTTITAREACRTIEAGWWWLLLILTLSVPLLLGACFVNWRFLLWALAFSLAWVILAAWMGKRINDVGFLTDKEKKALSEKEDRQDA